MNDLEQRLKFLEEHCRAFAKTKDNAFSTVAAYLEKVKIYEQNCKEEDSIFLRFCRDFKLAPFESNVVLLTLAPQVDQEFKARITDIRKNFSLPQIDVGLCLSLFSPSFNEKVANRRAFMPQSTLLTQRLIQLKPRLGQESDLAEMQLSLPTRILAHLLEQEGETQIEGFSRVLWPKTSIDQVILPEKHKKQILALIEQYDRYLALKKEWGFEEIGAGGRNMILLFNGSSGTGKTLLSQAIAHVLKRPLLLVDAHELQSQRGLEANLDILMREARLQRAVLLFDDCELIFASRLQGNRDLPLLLAAIDAYEGLIILTTNLPTMLDSALERRITLNVDFEIANAKQREEIWRLHIPKALQLADDVDIALLAEKYEFAGGTIRNTIAVAINQALSENMKDPVIVNMRHFEEAAKSQVRNKIKKLADKTMTSLTLDDLVLPRKLKEQMRAIIASVRNRRTIFEEWGFGEKLTTGKGLCILFRGDSGTGKTLSAEIIANELGMTLYRVRIPAIMSKYVGETEKNLEKCFKEAGASGALLLFDEADSIFSKRTEVQSANDRYSNMEVNLLLQEIERFEGVVILTTNLDAAIDDAFERRLNHKLDFPFPEAKDRAFIWRRHIPKQAPVDGDIDYELLGRDFDLSGGNIKNAVIRAAYKAAELKKNISMALLEACAIQEYREMGKLIPRRRNPWD
ncbi:MAG: ATP-binding protein [Bradymonadales bacterium]